MESRNGCSISASAGGSETRDADAPRGHETSHDCLGFGLLTHRDRGRDLRGAWASLCRRSHARRNHRVVRAFPSLVGSRDAGSRVATPAAAFLATCIFALREIRVAHAARPGAEGRDRRPPAGATPAGRNCAASRKRRCPVVSVERRPPRIPRSIAADLAGWLHRVRTVHGWLHSGVNVYARPETAGGRSLAGDNHAARAAAGDRSLLHDLLTRSVEELEAVREEVWAAMTPGPLTSQPGTKERINELARRVAAGQTLHTESDRRRWC